MAGGVLTDSPPESWTLTIDSRQTPAVVESTSKRRPVRLEHLLVDPRNPDEQLPCVPLFLIRANHDEILLPDNDVILETGDQLLFCGHRHAETHMRWTTHNSHALDFIRTGQDRPIGTLWRLFAGRSSS